MIRSMTGYGKAQIATEGIKYTVEIRSVNGKTAEISLKTPLVPREQENSVKQMIAKILQRGNIDVFISQEQQENQAESIINTQLMQQYLNTLNQFQSTLVNPIDQTGLLPALLKLPDVIDTRRKELDQDVWASLEAAIEDAANNLDSFRLKEGARLVQDMLKRVDLIEEYLNHVEEIDPDRIANVRKRLESRLAELSLENGVDQNRFEQELIYYLEKADITEEKVRLRQHCTYFRQTQEEDPYCGRKLSFIAQEMGREINTLGSKASNATMQQYVVKMKDELEKIKEQVLNVL